MWRGNEWILFPRKFKELMTKKISVDDLVEGDVDNIVGGVVSVTFGMVPLKGFVRG